MHSTKIRTLSFLSLADDLVTLDVDTVLFLFRDPDLLFRDPDLLFRDPDLLFRDPDLLRRWCDPDLDFLSLRERSLDRDLLLWPPRRRPFSRDFDLERLPRRRYLRFTSLRCWGESGNKTKSKLISGLRYEPVQFGNHQINW